MSHGGELGAVAQPVVEVDAADALRMTATQNTGSEKNTNVKNVDEVVEARSTGGAR